jgi:hypothetical protein
MRCSFGEYSPHATTVSSLLARRFKRCTGWLSYEEWIVVMVTPTDILYSALSNLDILHRATTGSLLGYVVSTSDTALLFILST